MTNPAVEAAMKAADVGRALTKPERWQDYGASIKMTVDTLPELLGHLSVLRAEVLRLRSQNEGLVVALESIAAEFCTAYPGYCSGDCEHLIAREALKRHAQEGS